jgi:50S ribosomal subunit-associated GTPase HflX
LENALQRGRTSALQAEESLEELAELAGSAGAQIVQRAMQTRPAPEAAT